MHLGTSDLYFQLYFYSLVYMIKAKAAAFLEGRLFSSQSEILENFSNCSDWLDKSRPTKKATFVLIM